MKLNPAQIAIARAYADGDFAYVIEHPESIAECGDILFLFLMSELSEEEGCEDNEEAHRRIDRAIFDLECARDALEQLPVEVTIQ